MKIRTVLEGIGAALLLVPFLPYIAPDHIALYLHGLPVTNLIGGIHPSKATLFTYLFAC